MTLATTTFATSSSVPRLDLSAPVPAPQADTRPAGVPGPAERDDRVRLGFWRGQRLSEREPRLRPGGKDEMATIELRESVAVRPATVRRLAAQAVALNDALGNPARVAKPGSSKASRRPKKRPGFAERGEHPEKSTRSADPVRPGSLAPNEVL